VICVDFSYQNVAHSGLKKLHVPTGNLPTGFYFLQITTKESRQAF